LSRQKKYSLRLVRRNYTYTVDEVAGLFDITPDTVFRWIRNEHLKRLPATRKYYIHSSDLKAFLEEKNAKNKHPCAEGEIYCCKCRRPRPPRAASIKSKKYPNKAIHISGKCSVCDTRQNKFVSAKKWSKTHPFHPDINAPSKPHNGEHISPCECQTIDGEQLCLNITL
jgi:excisionase family DNA binding protein